MIRRINLFAGPGCTKSTLAARLFSELKIEGQRVEYVQEYVKDWAYEGRKISSFDQIYLFAQQLRREDRLLRPGTNVDVIITDSPIELSICYAKKYGFKPWVHLHEIAAEFEQHNPSLNILLRRGDLEYRHEGRYETYEEALVMDERVEEHLREASLPYRSFFVKEWDSILACVKEVCNG